MPTDSAPAAPGAQIPLATIFAFGTVGLPLAALLLVTGVYVPRFYVGLGIPFAAVGLAVGLVRVIDVLLDPVMALFMDRTRTPLGRYRPWLIVGVPLVVLGIYMLLNPRGHVGVVYLVLWLAVTYAGNSMLTLGVAAWGAVLATSYNERARLYGLTQGMAVVGSTILLLLPIITRGAVVAGKAASMPTIGWILIAAFPAAVIICTLFTPEKMVTTAAARPRYSFQDFVTAVWRPSMLRLMAADLFLALGPGTTGPIYIFFFKDAKGFTVAEAGFLLICYGGAGIIGAPYWGRVAKRLGKHRAIQIACVCYAVTQTILMSLPRVWPHHVFLQGLPTAIGMASVGFCASAFIFMVRAMVADVVDEVRLEKGKDLTSLLYSMVTTTQKIGLAITAAVVFPILGMVHYDGHENAVNTPGAIFGLEMCYLFAPIILVFFGGAALFGYKLDSKRHGEIRAELDARDTVIGESAVVEELGGAKSLPSTLAEAG